MDFKNLRTDRKLEEDGIWLSMEPDDNSEFLIRSQSSVRYEKHLAKLTQRYQSRLQRRRLDVEANRKALIEAMADTIVGGWRTKDATGKYEPVVYEDGQAVAFSKDNCMRFLREYRAFFDWVLEQSGMMANFQESLEEDEEGN